MYLKKYTQDFTMCYYIVNKNNTDWCKAPEQERKMKNKILEFVNSVAVLMLFLSFGMYDSENIVVPIIMSLISCIWVLFVANRMGNEK